MFLMPGFIEVNWIFISASAFNLMQYVVLVEVYEEEQASHRDTVGKRRSILITFFNHFG